MTDPLAQRGPVEVRPGLQKHWGTAARVLWVAMNEDDEAYWIANDIINALDDAGMLAGPECRVPCAGCGVEPDEAGEVHHFFRCRVAYPV